MSEAGSAVLEKTLDKKKIHVRSAIIRFCGDSGDGMQITGSQFTTTAGAAGNDLMTFPDFPAEIRAPQGTLAGVSGFQIHFAGEDIHTPGDEVDVLVAMNPAALKANLKDLRMNGTLVVNTDSFDDKLLKRVGYEKNPVEDPALQEKYNIIPVPIAKLTANALADLGMAANSVDRCKNFFALGLAYWLYQKDLDGTIKWIQDKFKAKPTLIEANLRALKAGHAYAETTEVFPFRYEIGKASLPPGTYRNITGNSALAIGLVSASKLANLPLMLGSYPITPASDILHELARYKHYGVKTFQAEDEIAAVAAAIGASYGGQIGVTTSSGPGIALKMEAINLAVMTELPLLVINVQRGGPSTGLPTKTEQADLLQVMFGRNGESPVPIVSCSTPSDAFDCAIEAIRIALQFMTPVFLLSDGYIANGSEPWKLPDASKLPQLSHPGVPAGMDPADYKVYKRDEKTLARLWPFPGMAGFEHRIGGLEKDALSGNVSYDPDNHEKMVHTRAAKIAGIANFIPNQEVYGDPEGDLLVLGWGSTHGAVRTAVEIARQEGKKVSHAHLRYLNPFPKDLGDVLKRFKTILVPELNLGQLAFLIQGRFCREVVSLSKVKGRPFLVRELTARINEILGGAK